MRPARPLLLLSLLLAMGCTPQAPADGPAVDAPAASAPAPADSPTPADTPAPVDTPAPPVAPVQATADLLDAVLVKEDTLDSARARLGEDNVVAEQIAGAEGEMFAGWVLFPNDPHRRLTVYLDEGGVHPVLVQADADADAWHRGDGVRAGLDSNQLTELNGGPFAFLGFDWDYGGAIVDWKGGRLAPQGESAGPVRLCPPEFAGDYPDGYPVGDASFASDAAVVVAHPPVVCVYSYEIAPAAGDDDA